VGDDSDPSIGIALVAGASAVAGMVSILIALTRGRSRARRNRAFDSAEMLFIGLMVQVPATLCLLALRVLSA
jgi:hypothetical protein